MSVPPGASYRILNASVIAKRRLLGLEDPVRIKFDPEWGGSPLSDWYHRHSSWLIDEIQLRKEDEAPFFHEYITFRLRGCSRRYLGFEDPNSYFRIDRRQRPDENVPLDCIYKDGVEAQDTIEQVTSLEDSTYCSSRCLIEVKFEKGVPLAVLLCVAQAIEDHPDAQFYTLQRYNCYFFAQTVLLCVVRTAIEFKSDDQASEIQCILEAHLRLSKTPPVRLTGKGRSVIGIPCTHGAEGEIGYGETVCGWIDYGGASLRPNRSPRGNQQQEFWSRCNDFGSSEYPCTTIRVNLEMVPVQTESASRKRTRSLRWITFQREASSASMQPLTYGLMRDYLEKFIDAHSARVGQFRALLKCSADQVSTDIKSAMCDVWGSASSIFATDLVFGTRSSTQSRSGAPGTRGRRRRRAIYDIHSEIRPQGPDSHKAVATPRSHRGMRSHEAPYVSHIS